MYLGKPQQLHTHRLHPKAVPHDASLATKINRKTRVNQSTGTNNHRKPCAPAAFAHPWYSQRRGAPACTLLTSARRVTSVSASAASCAAAAVVVVVVAAAAAAAAGAGEAVAAAAAAAAPGPALAALVGKS